jgi:hypothetical protein
LEGYNPKNDKMRKVFLAIILIGISQICSAPNIDFRLGLFKYRLRCEYMLGKYHDSEFSRFINDLGYRESGNDWKCINRIGCFGEWQFDESTLRFLGYKSVTLRKFRKDPEVFPRELQLKALRTLIRVNQVLLTDYYHFIGDSIGGVRITRSGMIAASHLGGAGSLQKFLNTGGRINKRDVLGTSIRDYLERFRNYDLE